jgi:hypothetical protein
MAWRATPLIPRFLTCIRTYVHTHKHTHIHAHIHPYMSAFIHTCLLSLHKNIHTHTHTYTPTRNWDPHGFLTYIHTYIHAYTRTHAYIHIQTHTHRRGMAFPHTYTDIHTYMHTLMHTYIHTDAAWRATLLGAPGFITVCGILVLCFSDDCPTGNFLALRQKAKDEEEMNNKMGIATQKPASTTMGTSFMLAAKNYRTWVMTINYAFSFGIELVVNKNVVTYFTQAYGMTQADAGLAVSPVIFVYATVPLLVSIMRCHCHAVSFFRHDSLWHLMIYMYTYVCVYMYTYIHVLLSTSPSSR